MGMMERWAFPTIFLLNGFMLAQAQPSAVEGKINPSVVQEGLQSTIPLQVAISAFGAVSITNIHRGEWLSGALKRSASLKPQEEAVRAQRVILDALIKTHTAVPLTDLLPFFDRFPAAVLAIVAKNNSRGSEDTMPLLQKAEQTKNTTYWYAAASLVDKRLLIPSLLQQARFDYAIAVVDQDFVPAQEYGGIPRGVATGIPGGMGGPGSPFDWPEATVYHIEMKGDIDHALTCCIGGTTYLEAWSPRAHAFPDVQVADPVDWEDHDRDVVRALLSFAYCSSCSQSASRGDFPNVRGGKATIVWHSPEQARPLLEEAVDRYVAECVRMVAALKETHLSEPEIRSKVRIWIRDNRHAATTPIPDVSSGVEFNHCAVVQVAAAHGRCID